MNSSLPLETNNWRPVSPQPILQPAVKFKRLLGCRVRAHREQTKLILSLLPGAPGAQGLEMHRDLSSSHPGQDAAARIVLTAELGGALSPWPLFHRAVRPSPTKVVFSSIATLEALFQLSRGRRKRKVMPFLKWQVNKALGASPFCEETGISSDLGDPWEPLNKGNKSATIKPFSERHQCPQGENARSRRWGKAIHSWGKEKTPSSKAHSPLMTQDNTSTPSTASLKSFKIGREDQTTGTSSF